jgi:urease accessory protein
MSWVARLQLNYRRAGQTSLADFAHDGPLRILKSQYPEGPGICHNVIVHPPSGIVGGDVLQIEAGVGAHAHGLVCTPGATRFYRSEGAGALQTARLRLEDGARCEWLPMETMAYSGCIAQSSVELELAPTASFMGWDVLALGLPHAGQPFVAGQFESCWRWPGVWLERGLIRASDERLLNGPLGLAGHRCLGMMVYAEGTALSRTRREQVLELARGVDVSALPGSTPVDQPDVEWGVTSPQPQLVVVRALAAQAEPVMALFKAIWAQWRVGLWQLPATRPRIWGV